MAAQPFSTTRRTLLGAAVSLPAAALCEGGSADLPVIASVARQSSPAHET
jgi:hypothetical protein